MCVYIKINFNKNTWKYFINSLLSQDELTKYEYPGYYEYKPVVLDGLHCVRCSKLFQLDLDDQYTIPERCVGLDLNILNIQNLVSVN